MKFLTRSRVVHEMRYDYSEVTSNHVRGNTSRIPVRCNVCGRRWLPTINTHLNHKRGCPSCCKSRGELECEEVLAALGISYHDQYELSSLPHRYFDFAFEYQGNWYILEFDGGQHFAYNPYFHKNGANFAQSQQIDILKSRHVIQNGCYLIRIDYTQIDYVEQHIINALSFLTPTHQIYWSNTGIYSFFIEALQVTSLIFRPF